MSAFPVVGIGASAGGLEAFTKVLSHIPKDSGMAYVLVQHLDPQHESNLPEILGRNTTAPVSLAVDGQRIEANHVYVIPPNKSMTLIDGHLRLQPREQGRLHLPIDEFLMSMAEVQQNNAVGVILSGSGSDGARGIEAIKGEGGITFAQDPADARWDSMPRAAIGTACVDFILPASDIGQQLTEIGRHRLIQQPPADDSKSDLLKSVLALVARQSGVDFGHYKPSTVQRRVLRRLVLNRLESVEDYLALLKQQPSEIEALYHDLLIQVTRFFRDPQAFETLGREVFPRIIAARKPGQPIRVWVPGCSGGEETYSIAICLIEALGDAALDTILQIFGTDVSERAIAKARVGVYPESIAADVSEERLRRFFVKEEGGGYRVAKQLRDQCVFARQNLTTDAPFSQLDLISCRNVLIYLQPSLHARVFSIFHYALKRDGFLFLGSAETAANTPDLFTAINAAQRIYQRKESRSRQPLLGFGRGLSLTSRPLAQVSRAPTELDIERHADQIVLSGHAPAGVVIDQQHRVLQFRGRTADYLEPPTGSATFDLLKMVRPELLADLRDALQEARSRGGRAITASARMEAGHPLPVRIEVTPFRMSDSEAQFFVVLFEEGSGASSAAREQPTSNAGTTDLPRQIGELQQRLEAAERYARAIREEHEAIVQDLRASNEEVQSSNEELQSTNEELETAKEELQSVNEELTTLNEELRDRNAELGIAHDDLKNLFLNVQIPLILVGNDLRIRRFNGAADRVANLVRTDVGRRLDEIRLHIPVPDLAQQAQEVIDSLSGTEQELQDSSGRWYLMTIRPYRAGDNRIDGAVIVFHDINAVKQHALALQVASDYFATIVEAVGQPLLIMDDSLTVVSANRAFHESFGSTNQIRGQPLAVLEQGRWDTAALRQMLRDVLAGKSVEGVGLVLRDAGKGERYLLLNGQRLDFKGTRPPLLMVAIEDVTLAKRTHERESLLAEASAILGSTLSEDVVTTTVARLSVPTFADWCYLTVRTPSESVVLIESVYHKPEEDLSARALAQVSVSASSHPVHQVLQTGQPFIADAISAELLQKMALDSKQLAELQKMKLRSMMIVPVTRAERTDGALTFVTTEDRKYSKADLQVAAELGRRSGIALDHADRFTTMAAARASAEAANRAKQDFLRTMSHELRTPLNSILGYTELLEMEIQGPLTSGQRTALDRINYSRKHLGHLIEGVLQYTKFESTTVELAIGQLSVAELLQDISALFEVEMEKQNLFFQLHNCAASTTVSADAGALRQIVINLLFNAIKFTPNGGQVVLACVVTDTHVEISVRDTGVGIPAAKLETVFEPFVQLDQTPNRVAEGMGLGLAISRDLARRMGGSLSAVSDATGSTFTLKLARSN